MHYTDEETILIYLTAVFKYGLAAPSPELRKELQECPWLDPLFERHSFGSVVMRWTDLRTAVLSDRRPTKGANLAQVKRIVNQWEWLTNLPLRQELKSAALTVSSTGISCPSWSPIVSGDGR
jgi:hypothetical protein